MQRRCRRRASSSDGSAITRAGRACIFLVTAVLLLLPRLTFAQSPWERAAGNLERTFTGQRLRLSRLRRSGECGASRSRSCARRPAFRSDQAAADYEHRRFPEAAAALSPAERHLYLQLVVE